MLLDDNSIGLLAIYEIRIDSSISVCDYLILDVTSFVENVVSMADMAEVLVFVYDKSHSPA